jgi:hypothetical protein
MFLSSVAENSSKTKLAIALGELDITSIKLLLKIDIHLCLDSLWE